MLKILKRYIKMKITKLNLFKGGWFIGDFEPTLLKTKDFEIAVHHYEAGQVHGKHYHAIATEYNYLVSGSMKIQNTALSAGDLFVLEPNEIADPIFLENCVVVIVKTPSVPGDKYLV
jgi:quercetin dioxygenase-like cupin family protein